MSPGGWLSHHLHAGSRWASGGRLTTLHQDARHADLSRSGSIMSTPPEEDPIGDPDERDSRPRQRGCRGRPEDRSLVPPRVHEDFGASRRRSGNCPPGGFIGPGSESRGSRRRLGPRPTTRREQAVCQRTARPPGAEAGRLCALAEGQAPVAIIVGCADSRVSPEVVFDQGVGDLFVVRIAGNVVSGGARSSREVSSSRSRSWAPGSSWYWATRPAARQGRRRAHRCQ